MKVRGWVFVVTNPLAPELCRIAFSAKDPKWRAKQMNRSGAEQPFVVEYAVLVDTPHWYKLMACRKLESEGRNEWKEWFRCSPEDAAAAIREAVGKNRIFSEIIRGIESARRIEPGLENGEIPEPDFPEETVAETPQKIRENGSPSQKAGQVEEDSLELAAAIRKALENAEKTSHTNNKIEQGNREETAIKIEDVLDATVSWDAGKEEAEKVIEERRLRDKREDVHQDVEEVRRRMEEIKKAEQEPQQPQPKELDIIVASSAKVEKTRSVVWEFLIILLTDIGCIYIIIAAKSILIMSVAIILAAIFSLFLADIARTYWRSVGNKKK